jgi:glycosyltransferase involved in cell wall biosynthesis
MKESGICMEAYTEHIIVDQPVQCWPAGRYQSYVDNPTELTICVPVFNTAGTFRRCIQSILEQTHRDFTLIIIDNKSDDGTWQMALEFAAQDERVIACQNHQNLGRVQNWNRCLDMCRSTYIKFLMSNDYLLPTFVERLLWAMKQAPELVIARCSLSLLEQDGNISFCPLFDNSKAASGKDAILYSLLKGNIAAGLSGMILNYKILEQYKLRFNPELAWSADFDLFLRAFLYGDFIYLREAHYIFDNSKKRFYTTTGIARQYKEEAGVRSSFIKDYPNEQWYIPTRRYLYFMAGEYLLKIMDANNPEYKEIITLRDRFLQDLPLPEIQQEKPLVSVIIPCYKQAHFLEDAVMSVLQQDYPNFEILIINDGSPDNAKEIAGTIIGSNPQKEIYLIDKPNGGLAEARNCAVRFAKGEYILPLDCDDKLYPGALSALMRHAAPDTIVYGGVQEFGNSQGRGSDREFVPDELLLCNQLAYSSLYPAALWHSTGGYKKGLFGYEDWEFWIHCAEKGAGFIHCAQDTLLYRKHQSSMLADALSKHDWLITKIISLHPALFTEEDRAFAAQYQQEHPQPPQQRPALPQWNDRMPHAGAWAKTVIHHPNQYPREFVEKAVQWVQQNRSKLQIVAGIQAYNKRPVQQRTTVFVISVGDPALQACKAHLEQQDTADFITKYIVNVRPMNAAFQRMSTMARTPYFIQVDEDMMLAPEAVRLMELAMEKAPPDIAMICFHLWDEDRQRKIQGIKIYRTEWMKKVSWRNIKASEMDILEQLKAAGANWIIDERMAGKHGVVYTPETIYWRYKTLYEKDLKTWNNIPSDLFRQVQALKNGAPDLQIFAMLGSMHGIVSAGKADDQEKDFTRYQKEFPLNLAKRMFIGESNLRLITLKYPDSADIWKDLYDQHPEWLPQKSGVQHNTTLNQPNPVSALAAAIPPVNKGTILIVCSHFAPSVGGVETIAGNLATYLRKSEYQVEILCESHPQRPAQHQAADGIKVISLQGEPVFDNWNDFTIQIARTIVQNKYTACIMIADPGNYILWSAELVRRNNNSTPLFAQPIINAAGARFWMQDAEKNKMLQNLLQQRFNGIVNIAEQGPGADFFRNADIKTVSIPNAVDYTDPDKDFNLHKVLALPEDTPLILHVANFWKVKNHPLLLTQFKKLNTNAHLILIGNDTAEQEYGQHIRRLAADIPNVHIQSGLTPGQISSAMRSAKVLILPSIAEVSPVSILESMSHGLPWIATPACGSVHQMAGGIIVAAEEFGYAIQHAIENPEIWESLGATGHQHWKTHYTWQSIMPLWLQLIEGKKIPFVHTIPIQIKEKFDALRQHILQDIKNQDKTEQEIAVIIPCYNQGEYLRTAIESVIAQTWKNYQIIIVNDGSTDDTAQIADALAREYPCITVIHQENKGLSAARNAGIQATQAEYILPLDADDAIEPRMMSACMAALQANPQASIAYTDVQEFGEMHRMVPSIDYDLSTLCRFNYITATALYKRSAWHSTGGYDEQMREGYEDWNFWIQCGKKGFTGVHIPEALFLYRKKKHSMIKESLKRDAQLKSTIILNNQELFAPGQIQWAKAVQQDNRQAIELQTGPFISQFEQDQSLPAKQQKKAPEISPESDQKPCILFTMYGWNESGGGTTFPKSIAQYMAQNNMAQMHVLYAAGIHPTSTKPYFVEETIDNGVHLYGIYNRPTVFLDAHEPLREINDPECSAIFAALLSRIKPDIIHFHNFLGLSFQLAQIAHQAGIPSFYTPHNYHLIDPTLYMFNSDLSMWKSTEIMANSELFQQANPQKKNQYLQRARAARQVLQQTDCTFAVSGRQKQILQEFAGTDNTMIVINQVPISAKSMERKKKASAAPPIFGFIGGAMPHKGVHLLAAAAQVLPAGSIVNIHGFINEQYKSILQSTDKKGYLRFMGPYTEQELPRITQGLDIIVLPSIWEDCAPLVIAEAQALHLPCIAPNMGGFPDFIRHGYNGLLYNPHKPAELAEYMLECSRNPALVQQLSQKSILRYDFESFCNHMSTIYQYIKQNGMPADMNTFQLSWHDPDGMQSLKKG